MSPKNAKKLPNATKDLPTKIHIREFAEMTRYSLTHTERVLKGLTQGGYVDCRDAIKALAEYFRNTKIDHELKQKQIEVAEERRRKLELERRQKEGELVEVQKVALIWAGMFKVIRERLLQMPQKLAPLVVSMDASEAKATLEREVLSVLSELKEDLTNELRKT